MSASLKSRLLHHIYLSIYPSILLVYLFRPQYHVFFTLQNSPLYHSRRVVYQGGIWSLSDQSQMSLPKPDAFAWQKVNQWQPVWMSVPELSNACHLMVNYGCSGNCSRCKYSQANMQCTPLCKCKYAKYRLPVIITFTSD